MPNRLIRGIFLTTFALLTGVVSSWATHNRAGEITYRHLSGFTYEIKIVTCTKTSVIADREWLKINWGDIPYNAELDSIQRDSTIFLTDLDAQRNVYIGTHTYAGPGAYTLSVEDPNRNQDVLNVPNSVNQPFCIVSELIISAATGHNNSVILLNPPKESACLNKLWIHNPGAYDPDGDILTYELIHCRGFECEFIPEYEFPDDYTEADDEFYLDPVTGDVIWDKPPLAGEYNIAILITEWRNVGGELFKVGSVVRDMQILVITCDNDPPEIDPIQDTCIVIGENLILEMDASDPNGDPITLSAVGAPLSQVENPAVFNSGTGIFSWIPDCEEVRAQPYLVHFKATDFSWQVNLTDIESVQIQVIAPPVENALAQPDQNNIILTWDPHECLTNFPDSDHDDFAYKIYRRSGLYGYEPGYCETGVPGYTGYQLVGTVEGLEADSYTDAFGLNYGGLYCYMIVACWPDGSESIASEEVCAELKKDVPVITNVSVEFTDVSDGENYVAWSPPTDLDKDNFSGPYQYKLLWSPGFGDASAEVYASSISTDLLWGDTTFTHVGLDTETLPNTYLVEFYNDGNLVSRSSTGSSVFISTEPNDNQLTINMDFVVPWMNEEYEVYRWNEGLGDFELIGVSTEPTYIDSGLINNVEYCYRVRSIGTYDVTGLIDPILNWSQETCGVPYDLTPPCAPELDVDPDCESISDFLSWSNPNTLCADDVTGYNLYYRPFIEGDFELIGSFNPDTDTSFTYYGNEDLSNSIAGCFYITALDSILPGPGGIPNQNESEPSNIVCVDNCPIYFLPNVFTPNADASNDFFVPFPYKFVESIDLHIFNRWGEEVFNTTDPDINWDGTHQNSGQVCSDGVYYYTIVVNTIRLEGIVAEDFSGHLQLFDGINPIKE